MLIHYRHLLRETEGYVVSIYRASKYTWNKKKKRNKEKEKEKFSNLFYDCYNRVHEIDSNRYISKLNDSRMKVYFVYNFDLYIYFSIH